MLASNDSSVRVLPFWVNFLNDGSRDTAAKQSNRNLGADAGPSPFNNQKGDHAMNQIPATQPATGSKFAAYHSLCALCALLLFSILSARGETIYTFTKIGDNAGVMFRYVNIHDPVCLNDAGTVVFGASATNGISHNVFLMGNGGPLTIVAADDGTTNHGAAFGELGIGLGLNNSNQVAFNAEWTYNSGINYSTLVYDPTANTIRDRGINLAADVVINDTGTVASLWYGRQLLVNDRGVTQIVGSDNRGYPASLYSGSLGGDSINNSNRVAFVWGYVAAAGKPGVFVSQAGSTNYFDPAPIIVALTNRAVVYRVGSNATSVIKTNYFYRFDYAPSINDLGNVAFEASFTNRAGIGQGIFVGNGATALTNMADTMNDPFASLYAVAINNSEEVAFNARDPNFPYGGTGVFTGPNPNSDTVIASGDSLFGGTVAGVSTYGPNFLNNRGQIVFGYALRDGTQGIAVATPHPVLQAVPAVGAMELSWPDNVPGFRLQESDSLSPAHWNDVTNSITKSNGQFTLTVNDAYSTQFFRLSQ